MNREGHTLEEAYAALKELIEAVIRVKAFLVGKYSLNDDRDRLQKLLSEVNAFDISTIPPDVPKPSEDPIEPAITKEVPATLPIPGTPAVATVASTTIPKANIPTPMQTPAPPEKPTSPPKMQILSPILAPKESSPIINKKEFRNLHTHSDNRLDAARKEGAEESQMPSPHFVFRQDVQRPLHHLEPGTSRELLPTIQEANTISNNNDDNKSGFSAQTFGRKESMASNVQFNKIDKFDKLENLEKATLRDDSEAPFSGRGPAVKVGTRNLVSPVKNTLNLPARSSDDKDFFQNKIARTDTVDADLDMDIRPKSRDGGNRRDIQDKSSNVGPSSDSSGPKAASMNKIGIAHRSSNPETKQNYSSEQNINISTGNDSRKSQPFNGSASAERNQKPSLNLDLDVHNYKDDKDNTPTPKRNQNSGGEKPAEIKQETDKINEPGSERTIQEKREQHRSRLIRYIKEYDNLSGSLPARGGKGNRRQKNDGIFGDCILY